MPSLADAPATSGNCNKAVTFRARLEAAYMEHTGVQRRPTSVQLDRMVDLIGVLARNQPHNGGARHWTWPQLATALGFPVMGMSVQEIEDRYKTRVTRTMGYLVAAGYVNGWEVAYQGREPVGILVGLPAGVAQSVRAAES